MDQFDKEVLAATEQGSAHWLSERIGKFTASENWRLMVPPKSKSEEWSDQAYGYILEKVAEEISGEEKFTPENYAIKWGIEYEPVARKLYAESVGALRIDTPGFLPIEIEGIGVIAGASPDGVVIFEEPETHNEYAPFGCEIKCPNSPARHIEYLLIESDEYLKKHYREHYWQCQTGMIAANLREWIFISFDPRAKDLKLFTYPLRKNEPDCELLLETIARAYEEKKKIKSKLLKLLL